MCDFTIFISEVDAYPMYVIWMHDIFEFRE